MHLLRISHDKVRNWSLIGGIFYYVHEVLNILGGFYFILIYMYIGLCCAKGNKG